MSDKERAREKAIAYAQKTHETYLEVVRSGAALELPTAVKTASLMESSQHKHD